MTIKIVPNDKLNDTTQTLLSAIRHMAVLVKRCLKRGKRSMRRRWLRHRVCARSR